MSTLIRSLAPLALVLSSVAPLGCIQSAYEPSEADAALGDEEDIGAASMAVESVGDYFRVVSKQIRQSDGASLCLEPLDNVSGAPILQKKCNNSPLSASNPQAFFKHPTLGYRVQYALRDKNDNNELCIHLAGNASISNGVAAVLYRCDGTRASQVMWASPGDAAGYTALMAEHSHRCVSVFGGSSADLALVYQHDLYQYNSLHCTAAHQRWQLRTDTGVLDWTQKAPEGWATPPYCQGQ